MKILCIEDDIYLVRLLQETLIKKHYQVEIAVDGKVAWDLAEIYPYDLILLDLLLPVLDGISFCKQLRASSPDRNPNQNTPILLMTAVDEVDNKILGLDTGADDYVIKPFVMDELLARIRALLRRGKGGDKSPLLVLGDLCLDPNSCEVTYQNQVVSLGAKEYELLELFLRNPNRIFNSSQLLDRLWTSEQFPSEGAVRSHIKSLRKKLKQAGSKEILETIYKLGYRLIKNNGSEKSLQESASPTIAPREIPPLSPSTSSFSAQLCDAWQIYRPQYYQHWSIIQQSIEMLKNRTLTITQRRDAEAKAHLLIGSLGSFGFNEASKIARQLQKLLHDQLPLSSSDINQLEFLTTKLEKYLISYDDKEMIDGENVVIFSSPAHPISPSYLLLIDEDITLSNTITAEAATWGIKTEIIAKLEQARNYLDRHHPSLIIADLSFSDTAEIGLEFLSQIYHKYPEIPLIVLTDNNSLNIRLEVARLGSQCFLSKPITTFEVLSIASQIAQTASLTNSRLLVVDDDPYFLNLTRYLLEPQGYQLVTLNQPHLFLETLEKSRPDLIILDIELYDNYLSKKINDLDKDISISQGSNKIDKNSLISELNGINLCKIIRCDPRWNRIPIICLSSHNELEVIEQAISAGADSFLKKPIIQTELITHVQSRLQQRKLWEITDHDELTGISLRRKFLQDLNCLMSLARRQKQPLSLVILDLDLFKRINDQYGHNIGDYVLRYLGQLLSQTFRQEDIVGRWGGEEFVIGMYGSHKENSKRRLNLVKQQFHQHHFLAQGEKTFQMTFSAGIAQFPEDGEDLQNLYRSADSALYQAKEQGRDQLILATSS